MEKRSPDSSDLPSYQDATGPFRNQQPTAPNHMPPIGFQQPIPQQQLQQPQIFYAPNSGQVHVPLQQQAPATTVIITSPSNYGPYSQHIMCPSCGERVQTKIIVDNNYTTHILAAMLCLMGCFCCSCIPYFVDSCKNKNHYCPSCNAYLGTYYSIPQQRGRY